jgi:hypothetical protein
MFDALLALLAPTVQMPLGVDAGNNFTPFNTAFVVEVPYGLRDSASGDEMDFSHALTLSVADSDPEARLHAVVKGRLAFVAASGTESARLELRPLPIPLLLLRRNFHLSPLFKQVLYSNVEPSAVEAAMTALFTAKGVAADKIPERVSEFMAGSQQVTVAPGDFIGRPAPDAGLGGRRRLDLMIKDRNEFYLNPAHFLFHWPTINPGLENHPLLQILEPVQHQMIFASKSRHLYVLKNSNNPQPPYTAVTAANKIQDALNEAVLGDTVVVLDNETYNEKISMRNGVKLTSQSGSKIVARIGINANLPTIECPDGGPAVSFHLLSLASHISGFIITHAATKEGPGILVDNCNHVEIAKNRVSDNTAHQGGGIAIRNKCTSVFLKQNVICRNSAPDDPGGADERGQGGGIYIKQSYDITIEDNAIYGNSADNFGGGIAIWGGANISIKRNDIGIGPPKYTASTGNVVSQESLGWTGYALNKNPQGGGGGIGLTISDKIKIVGNTIQHNKASRGGGIEVYDLSKEVQLIGNTIANNTARPVPDDSFLFGGDGGGVAINMVSLTLAAAKLHSAVVLVNNIIEHNSAGDDGGGVYATGKALVGITGAEHRIRNNEAQFNGGGVRATFGSVVSIQGGHIELNSANNSNNDGGGGGVAFSNSVAKIVDCEIVNNTVIDFGGGGVYLITAEYTGLKGLAFETLLEDAYQFTQGGIELDGCVITGNAALDNHGAAGGLYVTYKQYPIKVKVKDTVLSPNAAQHSDVNKRWNVVIVSSADATNLANDKDLPQPITLLNHEKLYNP